MRTPCDSALTWIFGRVLRACFLRYAYPPPDTVYVFTGAGAEQFVVREVMAWCAHCRPAAVSLPFGSESCDAPILWRSDAEARIHGCTTVCRYLGRYARLYPTAPPNAAIVDEALEVLERLLATDLCAADVHVALSWLEESLRETDVIGALDRHSLADACWYGMVEFVAHARVLDGDALELTFPRLAVWQASVERCGEARDGRAKAV